MPSRTKGLHGGVNGRYAAGLDASKQPNQEGEGEGGYGHEEEVLQRRMNIWNVRRQRPQTTRRERKLDRQELEIFKVGKKRGTNNRESWTQSGGQRRKKERRGLPNGERLGMLNEQRLLKGTGKKSQRDRSRPGGLATPPGRTLTEDQLVSKEGSLGRWFEGGGRG